MSRFLLTFLFSLFFALFSFSQEQHQKEHGEYPDFVRPNAKIHFIYKNLWDSISNVHPGASEKQYSKLYSRSTGSVVTAMHQDNALALEQLKIDSLDYIVLMITDWYNPLEKRNGQRPFGTPYRFTFYDQVTGREWNRTLHCNNSTGAQGNYFNEVGKIKNTVRTEPEVRTGEPFHNYLIHLLLEEKKKAQKKMIVYYTKEDFLTRSGDSVGTFFRYNNRYTYYKNNAGKELELTNTEFYSIKIDEYDLIHVPTYGAFVTPIGYKEKYFYLNAYAIIQNILHKEKYTGAASPRKDRLYFVSDQQFSEIYPLSHVKRDPDSGLQVIFDCIEDVDLLRSESSSSVTNESNDQTSPLVSPNVFVTSEQYCVQKFLSGEL